eukprot:SAG31_NODE_3065_length_4728_cov_2.260531_5_plen_66_part_00
MPSFKLGDRLARTQATQQEYARVATDLAKTQDAVKNAQVSDDAWSKVKDGLQTALRDAKAELETW